MFYSPDGTHQSTLPHLFQCHRQDDSSEVQRGVKTNRTLSTPETKQTRAHKRRAKPTLRQRPGEASLVNVLDMMDRVLQFTNTNLEFKFEFLPRISNYNLDVTFIYFFY